MVSNKFQIKRRFVSSAPHLDVELAFPSPPDDLLCAPKRSVETRPFTVGIGEGQNLQDTIDRDIISIQKHLDVAVLQSIFENHVRIALVRRGLLWEHPIIEEETRVLKLTYELILGASSKFLTTYHLMGLCHIGTTFSTI